MTVYMMDMGVERVHSLDDGVHDGHGGRESACLDDGVHDMGAERVHSLDDGVHYRHGGRESA